MKILTIIAALFLLSCSKEKKTCWTCTMQCSPANPAYDTTICQDSKPVDAIRDRYGNSCVPVCR